MNDLARARDALNHIDAGCDRNEWVKAGMSAKSCGLEFDDFNNWSASAGNYKNESECRTVWKSFDDAGAVTPATLFGMAFAQGWKDPSKSRTKQRPDMPMTAPVKAPAKPVKQAENASAVEAWGRCIPATPAEPYIDRKHGKPDGLRIYPASALKLTIAGQNMTGWLVVPCRDIDGNLQTLQFISPEKDGKKLNLPGAPVQGSFVVGAMTDSIKFCESIGTAWSVNAASGDAAVCCFGAGNMAKVAHEYRKKYPSTALVIVPDKGKEAQAAKIAADVSGQWVAMPDDKPSNYDANDYILEHGTDALRDLLARPVAPAMRYKLLTDDDLAALPPLQWRIKGVLPSHGTAAVFGASGSGKSFLVLDMLQSLASGTEWFGRKVKQCAVTYIALEGEAGLAGRRAAYRIRHGSTSSCIRYMVQPFSLLEDGDIQDLAKAVQSAGTGGVVVLDTLNRAAPGADENDSKSMGLIIAAAKELQTLIGGLVILVHHTGKDASKGLRGHSSLHGALDAAIEVRRDGDRREWLIAKAKDGEDGQSYPFKLEVVEIGTDEDGDTVTSCTIKELDANDVSGKKKPSLSGNQKTAREVLGKPLKESTAFGMDGAPAGRPCINYDAAVELVAERMPTDAKHRKSRAQTAIAALVDKKVIGMKGDWLWDC
jgi:putative DNA primase/helicase